eukprot:gene17617-biopygen13692
MGIRGDSVKIKQGPGAGGRRIPESTRGGDGELTPPRSNREHPQPYLRPAAAGGTQAFHVEQTASISICTTVEPRGVMPWPGLCNIPKTILKVNVVQRKQWKPLQKQGSWAWPAGNIHTAGRGAGAARTGTAPRSMGRSQVGAQSVASDTLALPRHDGCWGTARGAAAEEAARRISATKTIEMESVQRASIRGAEADPMPENADTIARAA